MNLVALLLVLLPAVLHAAREDKNNILSDSVLQESNLKSDVQESLPNFPDPERKQTNEVEDPEKKEGSWIHIFPTVVNLNAIAWVVSLCEHDEWNWVMPFFPTLQILLKIRSKLAIYKIQRKMKVLELVLVYYKFF